MVLGCSACAWTVWSWIFGPPAGSALRPLHPPDSCSRFSGQLYEQIYRDLAAYETLDAQRFAFYDGFCARRQKACIRLRIANGAAYVLDMFPGYQSRHRSTLHALYRAISRFGGLPDVEVTIDLTDGELQNIDLPIFVITHKKEAPAGILYPDFTFYSWPESVCPSSETETSHNYDHLYRHFRQHWGMGARCSLQSWQCILLKGFRGLQIRTLVWLISHTRPPHPTTSLVQLPDCSEAV